MNDGQTGKTNMEEIQSGIGRSNPGEPEDGAVRVSVVLPCLNEERTLGNCIRRAQRAFGELGVTGEVVVADNGSTDCSVEIAESLGARVVQQPRRGYGNAYIAGLDGARGEYIVCSDADESYDLGEIPLMLGELEKGSEFVIGNRFSGGIEENAMPRLHRLIGNPLMSWLVRVFFKVSLRDVQSGLRAFRKSDYIDMDLRSEGFEFATEIVIKAALNGLKISEVPIKLHRDGRDREPHLRSFSDGWRNLRLMLIYSPKYLYFLPGFFLMGLGSVLLIALQFGDVVIGDIKLGFHFAIWASMLIMLGSQLVYFGVLARTFAHVEGLYRDRMAERFLNLFSLEKWGGVGALLCLSGLAIVTDVVIRWMQKGFQIFAVTSAATAMTLVVVGIQTIIMSFFVSMFLIRRKDGD